MERSIDTGIKLPVIEHFYSVQGEGYHTGKAAYFLRIGGCDVGCSWCDSKFAWNTSGLEMTHLDEIIKAVKSSGAESVVVTGGEPLMYNLDPLGEAMKRMKIKTYLETSGSHRLTGKWDWICIQEGQRKGSG